MNIRETVAASTHEVRAGERDACARGTAFLGHAFFEAIEDSGLTGAHERVRGYVDEPVFSAHWFPDARLDARERRSLAEIRPADQEAGAPACRR